MQLITNIIRAVFIALLMMWSQTAAAWAQCQTATPQQIANALQNSPTLNSNLKTCAMAAMAMGESGGGHTCAANSCCAGILQLNVGPSGLNFTPAQRANYLQSGLQNQINTWATTANSNTNSQGYKTLSAAYSTGQQIHGVTITAGMLSACEQFGSAVCNHNAAALQAGGTCGSYTDGNGHTGGQTICSWGNTADTQAAKQHCTLGKCYVPPPYAIPNYNPPAALPNTITASNAGSGTTTTTNSPAQIAAIPSPTKNWTFSTTPFTA